MSSDIVIRVSNLGKKYQIRHQAPERYTALRDVIARAAGAPFRRFGATVKSYLLSENGHRPPNNHSPLTDNQSSNGASPASASASQALRTSTSDVRSSSEDFWALRDVSFDVRRGEVLGIIGRNGAGKSTLLKILSRITEPTTGTVEIEGRVASLLEVGTGFHPELTGRENIFLNGAILGMTRAEIRQKFDEIVDFADVEKFLDTPVKRFSSGMYVRLAFAVAAHLESEILLVDEILAVGDLKFQEKCLGKIGEVVHVGRTVLFVSHNMSAITKLCDRALYLERSRLGLNGSVQRAIAAYSHHTRDLGLSWTRPSCFSGVRCGFKGISVELQGQQPFLRLKCDIVIVTLSATSPMLIAVDVRGVLDIPLMQALPSTIPFITGQLGCHRLLLEIDLPPLVPGRYVLDFWLGPSLSTTEDYVKSVIAVDVLDSPSANRFYPHSPSHGYLVPHSRCQILQS